MEKKERRLAMPINWMVKQKVKEQMLKPISYCLLKRTFCAYSTPEFCLCIRECDYLKPKEVTFRRRK